jgi:hypothetical protein
LSCTTTSQRSSVDELPQPVTYTHAPRRRAAILAALAAWAVGGAALLSALGATRTSSRFHQPSSSWSKR